ncbi:hypothetical protein C1I91_13485 [Clostridium manihotivorum]|uniref:histidine kinase n=1 Tax=Clostridium manihotivorum TaxID=2320868 RepID=A0A3R5X237_9CLOT|nr:hypothetical protein C1I91_13485 [Clostridium manihotivorum]
MNGGIILEHNIIDNDLYLKQLMESETSAVCVFTFPDLKLIRCNNTYVVGWGGENAHTTDLIGKYIYEFHADWSGSEGEKVLKEAIETGKTAQDKEFKYYHYIKGECYWNSFITPIKIEEEVKYIFCNFIDVTEAVLYRKTIEMQNEIIRAQKNQLEAITDNMTDALIIVNPDGYFSYLNRRTSDYFYDIDNFRKLGDSLKHTDYYYENGTKLHIDELPTARVLRGESIDNIILKVVRPDKTAYYSYCGTPIYEEGKLAYALVSLRDVSERYEQDRKVRMHKEFLEIILDNITDPFIVYDENCNISLLNKAALRLYPRIKHKGCIFGKNSDVEFLDFNNEPIKLEDLPTQRAAKGECVRSRQLIIKDSISLKYVEINAIPILDKYNNVIAIVSNHRDITDMIEYHQKIKNHDEERIRYEKEKNEALEASMKLKDEFLYLITHEFKTPITVIYSALQAIEFICKDEFSSRVAKYLKCIKQNTNRQLRLVNNLLDITKISSGNIKIDKRNLDIVYVTKAIIKSVELYAKQKNINIFFKSTIQYKEIGLDEEKYERIILNLLANALKFTSNDKDIMVRIYTKRASGSSWVCVEVKDQGIGIPKSRQEIIFEKFGQADTTLSRQAEGTGLGLHLVKLLVEALEGNILLDSQEGIGSTFTVMFPNRKISKKRKSEGDVLTNTNFMENDNRLIQGMEIEFSDIYF